MIYSPRGSFVWGSEAYFLGVPPGTVLGVPLGVVLDLPPDFVLIILGVLLFLAFLAVGNSEASRFEALSFRFRFFGFLGCVALLVAGLASSEDNFLLLSIIAQYFFWLPNISEISCKIFGNSVQKMFFKLFQHSILAKKVGFLTKQKSIQVIKNICGIISLEVFFSPFKNISRAIEAIKGTKNV